MRTLPPGELKMPSAPTVKLLVCEVARSSVNPDVTPPTWTAHCWLSSTIPPSGPRCHDQ